VVGRRSVRDKELWQGNQLGTKRSGEEISLGKELPRTRTGGEEIRFGQRVVGRKLVGTRTGGEEINYEHGVVVARIFIRDRE